MVDDRSRARAPRRAGLDSEEIGRAVPEELEGIAAFDERDTKSGQALQLDRANLRAILVGLEISLGDLVIVEQAAHAHGLAVEEIDEVPEEIRQIRFKARFGKETVAASKIVANASSAASGEGRGLGSPSSSSGR